MKQIQPETVVSIAWIGKVLGQEKRVPKGHKPLFTVQVNVNALKAQEFGGASYAEVEEVLRKLKEVVPYLDIADSGLFDKEQDLIERDMEKAYEKALRKLARKAIDGYKARSKEWISYRNSYVRRKLNLKLPTISIYDDAANIMDALKGDIDGVFAALEADWFSQQLLFDEAQKEFSAARQKYVASLTSK